MNRERAETHLRLLTEAEMREAVGAAPGSAAPWPVDRSDASFARISRVARALTVVHALDVPTAEAILADFAIAMGARQRSGQGRLMMRYETSLTKRLGRAAWFAWPTAGGQALPGAAEPAGPGGPGPGGSGTGAPGPGEPDQLVPLGLTLWYDHDGMGGELHLLSYSRTASGARFAVAWRMTAGASHPLPSGLFWVTDDHGACYSLAFTGCGGPDWAGEIRLRPDPPADVRWFDFAPPGGPELRVSVHQGAPQGEFCPRVLPTGLSPGEHLLNQTAERLLTAAHDFPADQRLRAGTGLAGPFVAHAAWLGDVVAALWAAEALPAASPLPGRLAALCASLNLTGHGLTAPPARDLPEPWLSLLAHYHRRKPDATPVWDGFAAVAAALPELDGIRLAFLGLHTTEGRTVLHLRASSQDGLDQPNGPDFPLSVWVRDSGGRWHAAEQAGWSHDGREYALTLRLVPPLARSVAWIEVLAAGLSAEVRARLPLRWGSHHD